MGQALQPAVAASDGLLSGVAAGHGLPVLTGIVELYAAAEALQVRVLTCTWNSVPRHAGVFGASNGAAYQRPEQQ